MQATLHGVLPVIKAAFGSLQKSALWWSDRLRQSFAVCHSLSMVNKAVVAGSDMDRSLFKAVEARFLVCSLPCCLVALSACYASCQLSYCPVQYNKLCRNAIVTQVLHQAGKDIREG